MVSGVDAGAFVSLLAHDVNCMVLLAKRFDLAAAAQSYWTKCSYSRYMCGAWLVAWSGRPHQDSADNNLAKLQQGVVVFVLGLGQARVPYACMLGWQSEPPRPCP
jgi:hypothetical protein